MTVQAKCAITQLERDSAPAVHVSGHHRNSHERWRISRSAQQCWSACMASSLYADTEQGMKPQHHRRRVEVAQNVAAATQ